MVWPFKGDKKTPQAETSTKNKDVMFLGHRISLLPLEYNEEGHVGWAPPCETKCVINVKTTFPDSPDNKALEWFVAKLLRKQIEKHFNIEVRFDKVGFDGEKWIGGKREIDIYADERLYRAISADLPAIVEKLEKEVGGLSGLQKQFKDDEKEEQAAKNKWQDAFLSQDVAPYKVATEEFINRELGITLSDEQRNRLEDILKLAHKNKGRAQD